jgi:hypothetical protein
MELIQENIGGIRIWFYHRVQEEIYLTRCLSQNIGGVDQVSQIIDSSYLVIIDYFQA